MREQPLAGITVLDFGQVYNGPYCGFLLAQAGARVIKVESPLGETLRGKPGRKTTASYPFALLNAGKECITINLKTAGGRALVRRLAARVDVLLENFSPGTMAGYGLGADDLRAANPRLIYACSTGYGSVGPYRDYLGMDVTLQAMSGVMSVTGEPDGAPMKCGVAFSDFLAGVHLYGAIVSALFERTRSGEGATVDVSMQDCLFPTLGTAMAAYYLTGNPTPRSGNQHANFGIAPYNVYPARDGHVAIICLRDGHWRRLCQAMGRPELMDDSRFADNAARCEHLSLVDATVTAWTCTLERRAVTAAAQAEGVICAPVQTLADVAEDPHLMARGTIEQRLHPDLGPIAQCHTPLRFRDIDPPPLRDVPALGAQTEAVLEELAGVSADELRQLRADAAI